MRSVLLLFTEHRCEEGGTIALELLKQGYCVNLPVVILKEDLKNGIIERFEADLLYKVDLSDEVLVIEEDGFIPAIFSKVVTYAKQEGLPTKRII